MLDNLPKDVPCKVMETKVRSLFSEILKNQNIPESEILQITVPSNYEKCYNWSVQLEKYSQKARVASIKRGSESSQRNSNNYGGMLMDSIWS